MIKKLLTLAILCTCLAIIGCGKRDADVNAAMRDLDSFTSEMVNKISSAKDPAVGLTEAQKYFDAKRDDIRKKINSIKDIRAYQISEETKKQMEDGITKNVSSVAGLQITYMSRSMGDKQFAANLEKLIDDYQKIISS